VKLCAASVSVSLGSFRALKASTRVAASQNTPGSWGTSMKVVAAAHLPAGAYRRTRPHLPLEKQIAARRCTTAANRYVQ
jgi:hypothetical protein